MTTTPQHTPTPWRAEYRTGTAAAHYGHAVAASFYSASATLDGRDSVAEVRGPNEECARANVALIVRAVNAYEPMREALELTAATAAAVAALLSDGAKLADLYRAHDDLVSAEATARAALALAEKE